MDIISRGLKFTFYIPYGPYKFVFANLIKLELS